jgi:hypothetical protein
MFAVRNPKGLVMGGHLHNFIRRTNSDVKRHDMHVTKSGIIAYPDKEDEVLDEESVSLAGSLLSQDTVYRFRLSGNVTVSYTTGAINTALSCDPSASGSNFPEWAQLSVLFQQVRLVEFCAQFCCPRNDTSSTQNFQPLAIGSSLATAASPGSYAAVADLADCKYYSFWKDTSPLGYTHHLKPGHLQWAIVSTPNPGNYAGCPGGIQLYAAGGASPSTALQALVWGVYEFRSRA